MYEVFTSDKEKLVQMPANEMFKWKFYTVKTSRKGIPKRVPIKFEKIGSKLYGGTRGRLLVYKKPHAQTFHIQLMLENSRALRDGVLGADSDKIMENMLDFVEEF